MHSSEDSKIIRIPSLDYVPDPRGLGCAYFDGMLQHKSNTAQIDALTGEKDTFDSLLKRCIRSAANMRAKGITANDIVTICSFNHLNVCVPYIAALFLGAKVAALDPTLSLKDVTHLLKQINPKMVFVGAEGVEVIRDAVEEASQKVEIVVFGTSAHYVSFNDFLQPAAGEYGFKPIEIKDIRDTALIIFSSGTSGLPKGICINHFAFMSQIANAKSFGFDLDILLITTSLYWITATLYLGVSIMYGLTRIIVSKFDASSMWGTIARFKPTCLFLAPTQILKMWDQECLKHLQNCSLKNILVGGSPIMKEQIEAVRKSLPQTIISIVYGQTEVAGFLGTFKPSNPSDLYLQSKKTTSCGRGISGISYKVVNPESEELLGANQPGEIRVKTEYQLNGYYNLDSSDAWDSNGWMKTGDVGYYDEDGCFYIVDRVKEMLKFQSWHVLPAVLEDILLTHPGVAQAVVIGITHPTDGDHPMGVVVLKKNVSGVTAQSIEKFVEDRVDDRQRLRAGVRIVDHLPITPTGKVKRRAVKEIILKEGI